MKSLFILIAISCFAIVAIADTDRSPVQMAAPSNETNSEIIKQLAEDMGEYFGAHEIAELGLGYNDLSNSAPAPLAKLLIELKEERDLLLDPEGYVADYEMYDVINPENGAVVGFIIYFDEYIDHPLHDGSGVTYYLDTNFKIVESTEWTG